MLPDNVLEDGKDRWYGARLPRVPRGLEQVRKESPVLPE